MIKPKLHPLVKKVLLDPSNLSDLASANDGPTRVLFPQIMSENISNLTAVLDNYDLRYSIQFAHKASKSATFIKQALKSDIGIDVASIAELNHALDIGFSAPKISCTGPKNNSFLQLAINKGVLISLDSLSELERLVFYVYDKCTPTKVNVLLRLSTLTTKTKKLLSQPTRFGISSNQLEKAYSIIQKHNLITLKGFHYHRDGFDAPTKAEFAHELVRLLRESRLYGHSPNIVNVGGSLRGVSLADSSDWTEYINYLCRKLKVNGDHETWGSNPYGMQLSINGGIVGREKALSLVSSEDATSYMSTMLSTKVDSNYTLGTNLADSLTHLMLEPGYALVFNAGITILKVIDLKQDELGNNYLVTNGNMYTLGTRMYEPLSDPIHISQGKLTAKSWKGYIVGNLCREDDFIMQRKVTTSSEPKIGDLLIFPNTGAYADFEDTNPILQEKCLNYQCLIKGKNINFSKD